MENNEEVILSATLGYLKYKTEFYGLGEQITNAR